MPFTGTIVSHDPSLHTGLVLPDGHQQAIGFTEGDVLNWSGNTLLFGEKVSFEVIQTPTGYVAVQMVLLESKPRRNLSIRPGNWMAAIVGPAMVAATTYLAITFFFMPPVFAYALSVNFITLLMFVLVATTPSTGRRNPAEVALVLMALCGGAPILFACILTIHSRLSSEGLLALLFAFVVMQVIVAQTYAPDILRWRVWWQHYMSISASPKRPLDELLSR
jgi:hypothetical protein